MAVKKTSAGIVLYRIKDNQLEVLIGHNGGPFFARKDKGSWSIPKGEFDPDKEDPLQAALREFCEETGAPEPAKPYIDLGTVKYSSGKTVFAWAAAGDFDTGTLKSNTFKMEWPKGSGTEEEFPEIDKAVWVAPAKAIGKLTAAQLPLLFKLETILAEQGIITPPPPKPEQQALF